MTRSPNIRYTYLPDSPILFCLERFKLVEVRKFMKAKQKKQVLKLSFGSLINALYEAVPKNINSVERNYLVLLALLDMRKRISFS
jgi:hypothetical protein